MANPSDPISSEDKDSDGDKQKSVSKQSKGGLEQNTKKDITDSKCIVEDIVHQLQALNSDFSNQETPLTHAENDGNISYQHLPSTDLSMDARACRRPKQRKSKDDQCNQEKPTKDFVQRSDDEEGMKKGENDKEEKKKIRIQKDIENLIKQLTIGLVSGNKFFDAAIVYDKNDYDVVVHFKQNLIDISKIEFKETFRIELFDSEAFAQSKITVVEDVLKRCSVVFVYLTSNFTSAELNLFIEEAIGMSRLGLGTEQFNPQNPWVLKPVHTMPRKSRNYKTPVGLLTVNGIDWFDRDSLHTINNVKDILKTAITQRKQREREENTSINYNKMFGGSTEMPHLGPPFNKPHGLPNFPQLPGQYQIDPYQDMMSFHQRSLSFQPLYRYPTNIRTDTQPSYFTGFQNMPYSSKGQFHTYQLNSNTYSPSDTMAQSRFEQSEYQMPPPPYSSIDHNQQLRPSPAGEGQIGQYTSTAQPEYIYQATEKYGPGLIANQTVGQLPNFRAEEMQQIQNSAQPTQMVADIQQAPVYPPSIPDFQRHSSNDHYPSMCRHLSQDAFKSLSGNFHTDQSDNTLPSGGLISRTNLSADDDVEVDNNTKSKRDIDETARHSQHADEFDDSEISSVESDSSSDSDSDCFEGARVTEKVVKIYKCKNVQLGEGNVVKEIDRKPERRQEKVRKQPKVETRNVDKSFGNNPVQNLPQNILSKTGMNISVSEDDMSLENTASGGPHNAKSINSAEKAWISENASNVDKTHFKTERTSNQKPNAHLKMSVGNKVTNPDISTRFTNVFSPDDNLTEAQLFGSGSLSSNSNPSISVPSSEEATFSFSQGIQRNRDFTKLLLPLSIDRDKNPEKTFDNYASLNSEELD